MTGQYLFDADPYLAGVQPTFDTVSGVVGMAFGAAEPVGLLPHAKSWVYAADPHLSKLALQAEVLPTRSS